MSGDTASVCVDASLVVKLFVPEASSCEARALFLRWSQEDAVVWAPDNLPLEVLNGIRKAAMFELISWEEARAACEMLAALPLATMRIRELGVGKLWDQFVAPFDGCVTPYDAAYLLIASHLDCDFWTADDRLVRTVGEELPWVRSLSELTDDGPVDTQ